MNKRPTDLEGLPELLLMLLIPDGVRPRRQGNPDVPDRHRDDAGRQAALMQASGMRATEQSNAWYARTTDEGRFVCTVLWYSLNIL